ncbi:hypothetical protein HII31_11054 [Pseudocercospora fuligena]|uniref:Uncharacterized protein n=1 Tax=Pseudocercospora fuligena TaxID=685502 RepID=A0A8H6VI78_9PEZI|nr:hypothetical protein HII31_11054 [Pseudocercospora fuligena]
MDPGATTVAASQKASPPPPSSTPGVMLQSTEPSPQATNDANTSLGRCTEMMRRVLRRFCQIFEGKR